MADVGRFYIVGLTLLVACAGCAAPNPVPSRSSAIHRPTTPASPVIPSPGAEEIARDVWQRGIRTTTGGNVSLLGERWVASGQCEGGGDLAVTYRVSVDGEDASSGTIICSTGIIYTNSAIQPMQGRHDVRVVLGPEVEHTDMAFVRVIPERLAGE